LVIFGRNVIEEASSQKMFFPTHLASASALPGET